MQNDRAWAAFFAFAVGCGSSAAGPPTTGAGGGGSSPGGSAAQGEVSGSPASAASGGAGGSSGTKGESGAGRSTLGGSSGEPSAGRGGNPNAGNSSGGTSMTAGAGGCVQNIGCTLQAPASSGDVVQDCVDRINQFRTQCACLPPLQRRTDGEACAKQMAEYDAGKNTAHAGYSDKICEPAGAQNECPGYASNNQVLSLCLQQMWDEGPPPMNPCDGDCFQKYGHFINMTSTTSTKVACGFYTTAAGKVWAVQNFSR
jgi:cysteine-rich secretory family protein